MTIITLPDELDSPINYPIGLYDYRNFSNLLRGKIKLTRNTFSFLRAGTKEVFSENESVTIDKHAFLVLKSGNCLMTEIVSTEQQIYRSILLFFTDEMLLNFLEKYKLPTSVTSDKTPSYLVCAYDGYIKNFTQSLEQIYRLDKALQNTLLPLKFEEIMTYLVQKEGVGFVSSILANRDDKVAKFVNVVENNKLKKLTLQELAFLCNMSLSSFKRAFVKQYDMSPIKWFQEKRLEHTAFLLSTQKKRPKELFASAGYETLSNFVQAFKKKFGVTPKQFQLAANSKNMV
ncbi:MAG: AraC family transcriptional regulator [Bacteroidota bacterium]